MNLGDALAKVDARQLRLLVIGCGVLFVAGLFSYGVLPRIKVYRQDLATLGALERVAGLEQGVAAELGALAAEVAELEKRLYGDMGNLPANQLESFVVGRLQSISWRNDVELLGVEPGAGETIQSFEESLFRVELSGDYRDLFGWLADVEDELGFVVIKEYEMRPMEDVAESPALAVRMTIASYRVTES